MAKADPGLHDVCHREFPRLVGLLALRLGDQHVAEELAQDALAQLSRHWNKIERPSAWLTRVALNMGNSWLRRKAAERRAYQRKAGLAGDDAPPDRAEAMAVRHAVARLPDRQRTAVILRYYEDLSVAETAEVMGCAPGTVKSLTHHAISKLESASDWTGEEAPSRA